MATATLLYRVDGGAPLSESTTLSGGESIQLTAASFAGWATSAALWEILDFPLDYPCPTDWHTDSVNGRYYYRSNTGPTGTTPPPFTVSDPNVIFGKWLFRVTVNGTIFSAVLGVKTQSPTLALDDLGYGESTQWGAEKGWPRDQRDNVRKLEGAALAAGIPGDAAYLLGGTSTPGTLPFSRAVGALASTLDVAGAAGVVPVNLSYLAAAGSYGAAARLYRAISGGSGAPDLTTGADLQWWIPNDAATPTLTEQVRVRPVLTAISGADLTTDLEWWLVDGGALTKRLVLHAGGTLTLSGYSTAGGRFVTDASGNVSLQAITEAELRTAAAALTASLAVNSRKITSLAAGGASGEAVEYDQLNTALGGYAPTSRTITAGAGLTGGGDLSANRTINVAAADATITVNADSVEASGDFVAKAIVTTSTVTSGAGGFIGPKWDRADPGALTIGDTQATSIGISGLPVTKALSFTGDTSLSFTASNGDVTVTTIGGDEVHQLDDDTTIAERWGTESFTEHHRARVTTLGATPVVAFTFTIPSDAYGHVELRVNAIDIVNGDNAYYEKRYRFSRRAGGTSAFAAVGTDIDAEDDASWHARVGHSSPTLSAEVTGDASNQTEFDVEWWVRYGTFLPI